MWMSRALPALLTAALVAGLAGACSEPPPERRCETSPAGVITCPPGDRIPAPTVTGDTLEGAAYDLKEQRGKVVVINFWGSWCAPCRAEIDDLQLVYEATEADGVAFLGVNLRDDLDKAKAFQHGRVTYPSIFDPEGRLAIALEVPPKATPATLVLDRQGRIAAMKWGAVRADTLRPVVAEVAAESGTG